MGKLTDENAKMIEMFARDFEIPYDTYKFKDKTLMVSYNRTETSNSEIDHYSIQVPAFLIVKYCSDLMTPLAKESDKSTSVRAKTKLPASKPEALEGNES